MVKPWRTL